MSPSNLHRCWPPPVSVSQIQSNARVRRGWSLVSPAESPVETTSFASCSGPPSTLRAGKVTPKIICSGVGAGALPMIPRMVIWGCVEPFKTFWNLCYVLLYHSWRGWTSICRLALIRGSPRGPGFWLITHNHIDLRCLELRVLKRTEFLRLYKASWWLGVP